jgi:hypothetical protein
MRTNYSSTFTTVALGLAVFSIVGVAQKAQTPTASVPPTKDVVSATVPATVPESASTVQVAATASPDLAIAQWGDIKDCTYDMRARFFAGLSRLEARVDRQISWLAARRAAMPSRANTQDWDFAMTEMQNARSSLKSMGEELGKAAPDIWNQEKDRVGEAWVRTQAAFDGVKSSTTN